MDVQPHFVLFAGMEESTNGKEAAWRFVLVNRATRARFEAADSEACDSSERLELLAVIRGLESLAQPSRVTLVTSSRMIRDGIRTGLEQWRVADWQWERFGQMVPINHTDLWQRIDRALAIHRVSCQRVRIDHAHVAENRTVSANQAAAVVRSRTRRKSRRADRRWASLGISLSQTLRSLADRLQEAVDPHGSAHPAS